MNARSEIISILREENSLMEIVKLIGADVLPDDQKLTIEIARIIRVGFLQQNAYHKDDTYVPLIKQYKMMETILYLYNIGRDLVAKSVPISKMIDKGMFSMLVKMKYEVENDHLEKFDEYKMKIDDAVSEILG